MAILQIEILSKYLERKVPVTAIVPIDNPLAERKEPPYKMAVLLHGYNGSNMDWVTNTDIVKYAEENNLAVVMPAGENKFYIDNIRTGEAYGKFIGEELIDDMRRLLPVSDRRGDTCIGGLSMGGYGAVVNGLRFPDTFGCIISLSGALFLEKLLDEDTEDAADRKKKFDILLGSRDELADSDADYNRLLEKLSEDKTKRIPDIYLACGTDDFWYQASVTFSGYMKQLKINHFFAETKAGHEWSFWNLYIEKALKWFCDRSSISEKLYNKQNSCS